MPADSERSRLDPQARLKKVNSVTKDVLEELDREYKPAQAEPTQHRKADKFNAVRRRALPHFGDGGRGSGFNSSFNGSSIITGSLLRLPSPSVTDLVRCRSAGALLDGRGGGRLHLDRDGAGAGA